MCIHRERDIDIDIGRLQHLLLKEKVQPRFLPKAADLQPDLPDFRSCDFAAPSTTTTTTIIIIIINNNNNKYIYYYCCYYYHYYYYYYYHYC